MIRLNSGRLINLTNVLYIDPVLDTYGGVAWARAHMVGGDELRLAAAEYHSLAKVPIKTSAEWATLLTLTLTILDPDGWDRANYDFSWNQEQIPFSEFRHRLSLSTVSYHMSIEAVTARLEELEAKYKGGV